MAFKPDRRLSQNILCMGLFDEISSVATVCDLLKNFFGKQMGALTPKSFQ